MIRAFLVDRETLSVERLSIMLANLGDVEVVGTATNASKAAKDVGSQKPHVVFVEAEQGGEIPMLVREMLESGVGTPCFVLISTSTEMAVDAFDAGAIDFLVKPFPHERLAETLRRIRRVSNNAPRRPGRSAASETSKTLKPGLY